MAQSYLRLYETHDPNPDTNSAVGEPTLTPDGLLAVLRGKTVTRVRTRQRFAVVAEIIFYLSDGSTMIISSGGVNSTDLYLDVLKKK
jgi:hypothetical protein